MKFLTEEAMAQIQQEARAQERARILFLIGRYLGDVPAVRTLVRAIEDPAATVTHALPNHDRH